MELVSHFIKQSREKSKAFSQITLDDDYIVKDSKPDVIKIIHTSGTIVFEETKLSNQALWVSGRLDFSVLYRSDDEHCKLEVLNGAVPFQEKMFMEGANDIDPIRISGEVEDLSIGLINSRKLSIRAVANLFSYIEEYIEEEIASGIDESDEYQQKVEEKEMLSVLAAQKDILRFHGEMNLPNAKPNMKRLLWKSASLRGVESSVQNGHLHVQGDIYVSVLYLSEEDDQIQWMESVLPLSKDMDGVEVKDDNPQVIWVKIKPESIELEIRNDYDGEPRVIGVDIAFAVDYKLWNERKVPVLMDVYALNKQVIPQKENCVSKCFKMKNEAKVRVFDTISLESNQEKILQICSGMAKVIVDRTFLEENGIHFEGVVSVHMLYLTSEDNYPVAHVETILPFEQVVEINHMQKDIWYDYDTIIDSLQVNLLDSSEYEVKMSFRIRVLAFGESTFEKISMIDEQPFDVDELMKQPGLVGYVTQEDEELWDIAKRYHTTVEEIAQTNNLKAPIIRPGMKLIIVKKINE